MNYLLLIVLVTTWCVIHSAMISQSATAYLKHRLGSVFRYYRMFYNVISILTLIPVAWFAYSIRTQVIFPWEGYMRMGQVFLLGLSVLLILFGGRHYNLFQVMGIKQIMDGTSSKAITESGELDTSGVLAVTRHPWYLAAILIIWARDMDVSAILVNIIFTIYLVIGTYLEEKKLVREFGEKYINYQQKVSMLIPFKWIRPLIIH